MTRCLLLVACFCVGATSAWAVKIPLIVQETLYPGSVPGISRKADPVTVGVPLPDNAAEGASETHSLTVRGAGLGQFRVLGRWPSGRIKWLLVDTQVDVNAGQVNTALSVTDGGSGSFGGPDLAFDNGRSISVDTGSARFTIRKDRFNVLDEVVMGQARLVTRDTSQGLVVVGPEPGRTACPCTTIYASANDPASTAVIEENGPVKAVIRASGAHVSASGQPYMRFTLRMYFYKGKSHVRIVSVLRNADYGRSGSSATAFKGHQGYELRLKTQLSGPAVYAIAGHSNAPASGALQQDEAAYLYQGESPHLKWQDWCGFGCVPYSTDKGYAIVREGAVVARGDGTQPVQGWADIRDNTGSGVQIGVYQLSAYWPKSLEFHHGGGDVRIGIWPRQNSKPYYQPWPQWSIHELYLNFHQSALNSPASEFLKLQHYLVGRTERERYNAAGVFPYALIDPAVEDSFYRSTARSASPATISQAAACCIEDVGTRAAAWPLNVFRFYAWGAGSGANQTEFRWSYLLNFLTRGMTGRYLNAAHFYRFQAESFLPHSDGFNWRDRPGEYDGFGLPTATSENSTLGFRNWRDQEHGHWYGMTDYYFLTGDETVREALFDQAKDWYLNPNTYQNGRNGGLYNSRSVGIQMVGAARFGQFLADIGDRDAQAVLDQGVSAYTTQVKPELCVSGFPKGCSPGSSEGGGWRTQGVSRTRGVPWGQAGTSGTWCGVPHAYRMNSPFQTSILIQGVLELARAKGRKWPEYYNALDLAYGIARWNLSEAYVDDGSGRWDRTGFRFGLALDVPNRCAAPGESPEPNVQPTANQTIAMTFLAKHVVERTTDWATQFKVNTQRNMSALGMTTSDFGSYQLAQLIAILNNPGDVELVEVPIRVQAGAAGSYSISWEAPAGAESYRIKWAPKPIVDWIGFDPLNNTFIGDPANSIPWFAAANVPELPTPAAAGSTQTIVIQTKTVGLTARNVSVKAYVRKRAAASGSAIPFE